MTTRHNALDTLFVPTSVPNSVTTRLLVLDHILVHSSNIPTVVTIHQLNFVTIRHLVLHPIFFPIVPMLAPIFYPLSS